MAISSLCSRLLVAAGAVLLSVASWFSWRRRPPGPPGLGGIVPERQALLAHEDRPKEESASTSRPSAAPVEGSYEAPAASSAPVSAEDVVMAAAEPGPSRAPAAPVPPKPSPAESSEPAASGQGPAGKKRPAEPRPEDEEAIKARFNEELGPVPPRFAVRKEPAATVAAPREGASGGMVSLQELLDEQFGPPKFAVPKKPDQAGTGAEAGAGSGSGSKILTLVVTHGPEAGKRFVADNTSTEYVLGRLPDCAFQILDQEISGRHAAIRWHAGQGRWMLHDVGSLNGTSLGGAAIGKDYKVPGPEHPLLDGSLVDLGSATRLRAELGGAAPLPDEASLSPGRAGGWADSPPAPQPASPIGPPEEVDVPALGLRLAVHNRLGFDHKRMGQGCEDVPYWELPYAPYDGAGVLCVFDGHHGSKGAGQAREHLPAVLRTKLLLRDGRSAPQLAPPPPKPQPRRGEGEDGAGEEGEESGYAPSDDDDEEDRAAKAAANAARKKAKAEAAAKAAEAEARAAAEAAVAHAAAGDTGRQPPPPQGPPLPPLLEGRPDGAQQTLLKDVFLTTDTYMSMEEGCTATVVLLEARRGGEGGWLLQTANVGDSSAVLINFTKGTHARLSDDHRISSSAAERQRLAERGHTVRTRLYGLNISRMLGDRFLKDEDIGFLAEPFVSGVAEVGPEDSALLVVASDGLWDAVPEERAGKMLLQEAARSPPTARSAADLLLRQALAGHSKDDITVAVLELGPHLLPKGGSR
ncbi:hypothetical protein HYH03_001944 [Edaphochlamys debaryana]|uniref:Uncharacterized protein n=1 Tax=Edaphochlamys debaryana TaxID=47281 RepID=A0A835YCG8_9CHLO|nr:hypothetical protein HYH03_001944 [Edaphochlamys debaryana]|eukprot:KAG2500370.1 hypothetical protein HYH03_001944 [Edaphochlamys debaryana]